MGFPNVYAVAGGTTAWKAAGKSLAAGTDEPVEPLVAAAREQACVRLRRRRWRHFWHHPGRPSC